MSFFKIITEAINDMIKYGYDNAERIKKWRYLLRNAIMAFLIPEKQLRDEVEQALTNTYRKLTAPNGALEKKIAAAKKQNSVTLETPTEIARFTVEQLTPSMREELDRRIVASANLIEYNREKMIAATLQRFEGWSTSIPKGGVKVETVERKKEKTAMKKTLANTRFEERRVIIDQTHKLTAAINDIVNRHEGAIAYKWRSNWRRAGYDYREDHKERDDKIYIIRGTEDDREGLLNPVHGYYDEITAVAVEPYCSCYTVAYFNVYELPPEYQSKKYHDKNKIQ